MVAIMSGGGGGGGDELNDIVSYMLAISFSPQCG